MLAQVDAGSPFLKAAIRILMTGYGSDDGDCRQRLRSLCVEDATDVSSGRRRVTLFKSGHKDTDDRPRQRRRRL